MLKIDNGPYKKKLITEYVFLWFGETSFVFLSTAYVILWFVETSFTSFCSGVIHYYD
jgi:hypothetical protein